MGQYDLINKAGGVTKNADTSLINLSKKLKDEMVVIIYSKEEVATLKEKTKENTENICPKENDACANTTLEPITKENIQEETVNTKISINTATIEELQNIKGIGKSKAEAIIKYRDENGKFKKIEDIKNVSGIGDAAFEKIKDQITI